MFESSLTIINKSVKRNPDLYAAAILALVSLSIANASYSTILNDINPKILMLLLSLMVVIAGLRVTGFLDLLYIKISPYVSNARRLARLFIFVNFLSSMFITNDVSLIIFIPLSISTLIRVKRDDLLIPVVSLQTIAANMGSMLTPIGNPQNLFIYSYFRYELIPFTKVTLPVFLVCFVILYIYTCFIDKRSVICEETVCTRVPAIKTTFLLLLFCICILCVLRVLNVTLTAAIVLISVLVTDRKLILMADYKLLLLFVFLFIFVSNLGRVETINALALEFVQDYEFFVSLCLSQIISNVPATVMLAGFTKNPDALLLGVNVGGLGTIIASMASLISFKYYIKTEGAKPLYYMKKFTKYNIQFLMILLPLYMVFKGFV